MPKVPVLIITGYLGAGKTTLLQHILANADRRYAIVMNEFGEMDIDGKVLRGKDVEMVELMGGCVCCSISGEFEVAIKEILEKARPDAIILETTGVAEPDAIALSLEGVPDVRLEAVVCVVDADGLLRFPSLGLTGRAQIEMADLILLNKTDLVGKEALEGVEKSLRGVNPKAPIVRTKRCEIHLDILFPERRLGRKPIPHVHTEVAEIESFLWKSKKRLSRGSFESLADSMPAPIIRAKGFVRFAEDSFLWNFVAGRWDLEPWLGAEQTELVFIGKDISPLKERIFAKLKECEA